MAQFFLVFHDNYFKFIYFIMFEEKDPESQTFRI